MPSLLLSTLTKETKGSLFWLTIRPNHCLWSGGCVGTECSYMNFETYIQPLILPRVIYMTFYNVCLHVIETSLSSSLTGHSPCLQPHGISTPEHQPCIFSGQPLNKNFSRCEQRISFSGGWKFMTITDSFHLTTYDILIKARNSSYRNFIHFLNSLCLLLCWKLSSIFTNACPFYKHQISTKQC